MVTDDLSKLIISGQPDKKDLVNAWQDILQEYSDLIKSEKSKSIFEAWKKVAYTEWQIKFIEAVILKFRMKNPETDAYLYNREQALQVSELGYSFIPEPENEEDYLQAINFLDIESRNLTIFLNQYTVEYNLLCPKQEEKVKRQEIDYDTELAVLSKFMGTFIDKRKRSVQDVCAIINVFNQHNEIVKKQTEKNAD